MGAIDEEPSDSSGAQRIEPGLVQTALVEPATFDETTLCGPCWRDALRLAAVLAVSWALAGGAFWYVGVGPGSVFDDSPRMLAESIFVTAIHLAWLVQLGCLAVWLLLTESWRLWRVIAVVALVVGLAVGATTIYSHWEATNSAWMSADRLILHAVRYSSLWVVLVVAPITLSLTWWGVSIGHASDTGTDGGEDLRRGQFSLRRLFQFMTVISVGLAGAMTHAAEFQTSAAYLGILTLLPWAIEGTALFCLLLSRRIDGAAVAFLLMVGQFFNMVVAGGFGGQFAGVAVIALSVIAHVALAQVAAIGYVVRRAGFRLTRGTRRAS